MTFQLDVPPLNAAADIDDIEFDSMFLDEDFDGWGVASNDNNPPQPRPAPRRPAPQNVVYLAPSR